MPLPCGKKKEKKDPFEAAEAPPKEEKYHPRGKDYQSTNACQLKKGQSPFRAVASSTMNATPTSNRNNNLLKFERKDTILAPDSYIPEGSYL